MQNTKIFFTQAGWNELESELVSLQAKREPTVLRLQAAREQGDLSENGAYKAARFELSDIDHNIRRVTNLLKNGQVKPAAHDGRVGFGNKVILEKDGKQMTYLLVSKYESDPQANKLSVESPLGLVIMGKSEGDEVTMQAPAGEMKYKIIRID